MALAGYLVQVEFCDRNTVFTVGTKVGMDITANTKLAPLTTGAHPWVPAITPADPGTGYPVVVTHPDWP